MIFEHEFITGDMLKTLELVRNMGVDIFIDGHRVPRDAQTHNYVNEEQNYMADYVIDDFGELKELRYDKVLSE